MRLLLLAGLLYLLGISVILVMRPELMFAKSGRWKEFGLGRNKEHYTWMPFWLFSILWAIISYMIVVSIASNFSSMTTVSATASSIASNFEKDISVSMEEIEPANISKKTTLQSVSSTKPIRRSTSLDMKPGYYILDTQETIKTGIPKYIFLGPEAPNLIYNNATELQTD